MHKIYLFVMLGLSSIFWVHTEQAHSPDTHQISIAVDASASSASEAKKQAINTGLTQAFDMLIARLVPSDVLPKIPAYTNSDINDVLINYSLRDEKFSSTRYRADVNYNFDGRKIRSSLQQHKIPYLDKLIPRLIVIPLILVQNTVSFYWPALEIFQELEKTWQLFDILRPLGDLDDEKILAGIERDALNQTTFNELLRRYDIQMALVVIFKVPDTEPKGWAQSLEKIRVHPIGIDGLDAFTYQLSTPDTLQEAPLRHHLNAVFQILAQNWQKKHLVSSQTVQAYQFNISIQGIKSLLTALTVLKSLPRVQRVSLRSFDTSSMIVDVWYLGPVNHLEKYLHEHAIEFHKTEFSHVMAA